MNALEIMALVEEDMKELDRLSKRLITGPSPDAIEVFNMGVIPGYLGSPEAKERGVIFTYQGDKLLSVEY